MSEIITHLSYLAAATLFIFSLRWLNRPATARRGVAAGVAGMSLAIFGTLLHPEIVTYSWIAIAAVSPHRTDAVAACRAAIDRVKTTVPIWKKEFHSDGSSDWVDPTQHA